MRLLRLQHPIELLLADELQHLARSERTIRYTEQPRLSIANLHVQVDVDVDPVTVGHPTKLAGTLALIRVTIIACGGGDLAIE